MKTLDLFAPDIPLDVACHIASIYFKWRKTRKRRPKVFDTYSFKVVEYKHKIVLEIKRKDSEK